MENEKWTTSQQPTSSCVTLGLWFVLFWHTTLLKVFHLQNQNSDNYLLVCIDKHLWQVSLLLISCRWPIFCFFFKKLFSLKITNSTKPLFSSEFVDLCFRFSFKFVKPSSRHFIFSKIWNLPKSAMDQLFAFRIQFLIFSFLLFALEISLLSLILLQKTEIVLVSNSSNPLETSKATSLFTKVPTDNLTRFVKMRNFSRFFVNIISCFPGSSYAIVKKNDW